MKLLKILYFLFISSLFTGEIFRFQFGVLAVTLSDVTLFFLIVTFLVLILCKKVNLIRSTRLLSMSAFLFVCGISLAVNSGVLRPNELATAFLYTLRWGAYAALYPITQVLLPHNKLKITRLLEVGGVCIVFLGFIQLFLYPSLRNLYYLGWDEHIYRLFTVFLDPNFAGTFFALFSLFIIHQLIIEWKNQTIRYLHLGAFLLSTLALIFTFSRSGMVLFVIGIISYFVMYKRMKYIVVFVISLLVVYLFESSHFHIENINLFRTTSSLARVQTAGTAMNIFTKNPILGVGFDAYRYAQIRYGYRPTGTEFVSHADAGTDNSYLFVLATTGVVGFLVYLFMWMTHFRTNGKKRTHERRFLIVSVAGLGVNAFFINSLFYPFIMAWIWILFGIYGE